MRKPLPLLTALALAAVALPTGGATAFASKGDEVVHLREESLRIRTGKATQTYRVEVASTPEQQERGLMFRRSVPRHGGMIFPMNPPREATFWMKNTLVPLDLVFIRANGTVARIAANAVPYSLNIIDSGEPVAAVLELAGGEAERDGVTEASKVEWAGLNASH